MTNMALLPNFLTPAEAVPLNEETFGKELLTKPCARCGGSPILFIVTTASVMGRAALDLFPCCSMACADSFREEAAWTWVRAMGLDTESA